MATLCMSRYWSWEPHQDGCLKPMLTRSWFNVTLAGASGMERSEKPAVVRQVAWAPINLQ